MGADDSVKQSHDETNKFIQEKKEEELRMLITM